MALHNLKNIMDGVGYCNHYYFNLSKNQTDYWIF